MATTADSGAVFLDTNVLLTATTPARPLHEAALEVFDVWPDRGLRLCTSGQVLREYLVVATRPAEVNGLGLSLEDALVNASRIGERLQVLAEGEATLRRLERIVRDFGCRGKQVHDAHIVATALEHGVAKLVTENTADFLRSACVRRRCLRNSRTPSASFRRISTRAASSGVRFRNSCVPATVQPLASKRLRFSAFISLGSSVSRS